MTDSLKDQPTKMYDLKIEHNLVNGLKQRKTFILEINITNTNPVTNLDFDISEMQGHHDAFHFGKPAVLFGAAYINDDPLETENYEGKLMHLEPVLTSSGKLFCCCCWCISF